jgi:antitoxin component HigA of HigAB toxin-antitoxin module
LLAKAPPAVVKSEDENGRMLAIIEGLMAKGKANLTAEEDALLELLIDLAHDFEERHDAFPASPPHLMVAFLLNQRGLKPSALYPVLATKSGGSQVLSGKRGSARSRPRGSRRSSM